MTKPPCAAWARPLAAERQSGAVRRRRARRRSVIGGSDIRLFGIDAFELHQMCEADSKMYACGELANQDLAKKVQGRNVHCEQRDYDAEHKRPVAVCSTDGEDLNAWMVSEGWAVAYRKFSND